MRDDMDILDILTGDLENTRRRLIRDVSRADALEALLVAAIAVAERTGEPVSLDQLEADAKAQGAVDLARYQALLAIIEATGDQS